MKNRVKLHYGNSSEVLQSMPRNSVDAIITDPPSGTNMMVPFQEGKQRYMDFDNLGRLRYNFKTQSGFMKKIRPRFEQQVYPTFVEMAQVLKPGGYAVVWGFHRSLHWTMEGLERAGFSVIDIIIRRLRRKRPTTKLIDDMYSTQMIQEAELWIVVRKDGELTSKKNFDKWGTGFLKVGNNDAGSRLSHIFEGYPQTKRHHEHPAEKTVEWMRRLIDLACPLNGIVLDPFMGSGTTGEAAVLEGREFWGVEADEHWYQVAKTRLVGLSGSGWD